MGKQILFHVPKIAEVPCEVLIETRTISGELLGLKYGYSSKYPKVVARTHTLLFHNEGNVIFTTWAKPHTHDNEVKLDSFSRKAGKKLAELKMEKLLAECATLDQHYLTSLNTISELKRFLPNQVSKNLGKYAKKAANYFKIDDPEFIVRGVNNSKIKHSINLTISLSGLTNEQSDNSKSKADSEQISLSL